MEQRKIGVFNNMIKYNIGYAITKPSKPPPFAFIPYYRGDLDPPSLHEVDEDPVKPDGTAIFKQNILYHWIHAELNLPQGEEKKKVKLFSRSKDEDVNIIGKYDTKPVLNTMVYGVEFPDGSIRKYWENVIADNMYSQVDSEGFLHHIISVILDFAKDKNAV